MEATPLEVNAAANQAGIGGVNAKLDWLVCVFARWKVPVISNVAIGFWIVPT